MIWSRKQLMSSSINITLTVRMSRIAPAAADRWITTPTGGNGRTLPAKRTQTFYKKFSHGTSMSNASGRVTGARRFGRCAPSA